MLIARELMKSNKNIKKLRIIRSSFYTAKLCWNFEHNSLNDNTIVQIQDLTDTKQEWIINLDPAITSYDIPFKLVAGHSYLAYVCTTKICNMKGIAAYEAHLEAKAEFRAGIMLCIINVFALIICHLVLIQKF